MSLRVNRRDLNLAMFALPSLAVLAAAFLAALQAVVRAVRINPVAMLRAE